MNKKSLNCVFLCIMLLMVSMSVYAADVGTQYISVSTETVCFDDGSTLITTISESPIIKQNRSGLYEKDGSKKVVYNTASGTTMEYIVYGTFRYDNSRAEAIDAWDSYSIYNSSWSCSSHSAYTSGASAKGSSSFRNVNGTTKKLSATLTCSVTGKLS